MMITRQIFILLLFFAIGLHGQEVKTIRFSNEKVKTGYKSFYISDVVDSLDYTAEATGVIGYVKNNNKIESEIRFESGLVTALNKYFTSNTKHNADAVPITLVVKEMSAKGAKSKRGITLDTKSEYFFYFGTTRLSSISVTGHVQSPIFPAKEIDLLFRKTLKNCLQRFDSWWVTHKDSVATDTAVQLNVEIAKTSDNQDLIIFSSGRKLVYSDFEGDHTTNKGNEVAVTGSGISIEYSSKVIKGKQHIDLKLTPAFNKKNSWFKPEGKNEHVLSHEQTHFDITALKVCEMADTLRKTTVNKNNYQDVILKIQNDFGEAAKLQEETYDNETNHGQITQKQHEWEAIIRKKIAESGCY